MKMRYGDMKVGKFTSRFEHGDVFVEYCVHQHIFYLIYALLLPTPEGWMDGSARVGYDPTEVGGMRDMVFDAMDIADTPLKERD